MSPENLSLLVVGSNANADDRLRRTLRRRFALVEFAEGADEAEQLLPRCHFDCILTEVDSATDPALTWLEALPADGERPAIFVAAPGDPDVAAAVRRAGALDVLPRPLESGAVLRALRDRARRTRGTGDAVARPPSRSLLVGDSASMRAVRGLIARIAPTPATVLVDGETGTGKELVARLLHERSGRRGPFVPVNCGAIAPELMESELFGHSKGAFTGAHQQREGLFVAANEGTLFLDEISEMRLDLQVKLLRALEEGAIRPVGTDRELPIEVRIVASTRPGLEARVREGRFREDLFYRLNVIHVKLPPLRERPDDIESLARHFMARVAAEFDLPPVALATEEIAWLREQSWSGNVRELRNVIERTVLMGSLPDSQPSSELAVAPVVPAYPLEWTLEQVKQAHIERVLEANEGNRSAAARQLGLSRKTLERKLGPAGGRPEA
jgi:DNA-binding NtrC family response regulator